MRRPPEERAPSVVAPETTRAKRAADALERDVANGRYGGELDAAVIALGCALGYCGWRHMVWRWRQSRPTLAAWFDRIAAQPAFQAAVPPVSGIFY